MSEPKDIKRTHISPTAAKRILVAIDATEDDTGHGHDAAGDVPGRSAALLPRINGYTIERELGRGAGGITYLAHKQGSEAKIALKVLHSRSGDGAASQRAWRELDTLQQIRVPSVPRLLDFGTTDHSMYIATEYIEGTSLSELYDHVRPADLTEMRERVRLLEKITRAAHALHERGVIHRDLKPSNVIVTPTAPKGMGDSVGEPFIIDLGIALIDTPDLHQSLTHDGQPIGTPAFMAPEQARGRREEISTRSDIYSLGAIGYWLCTGETPHDLAGVTLHEAIRRVGSEPAREAKGISKAVPKGLAAVLGKACEQKPVDRYGSPEEFAEDLLAWQQGRPVTAGHPSLPTRLFRWAMAHTVWATAVVCTIVALCIVGGIYAAMLHYNSKPASLVLSQDGRFLTLRSVSGRTLHEWDAGVGCAFPQAHFLHPDSAASLRPRLAIQMPIKPGDPTGGYGMAMFDPEKPDSPLWTVPTLFNAPPVGTNDASGIYIPGDAVFADVLPDVPGLESIQCYRHPTAYQSLIAVFDQQGHMQYSAWHWGPLSQVLWIQSESMLVVLADDWEHPWIDLGLPDSVYAYPTVLFALRPEIGVHQGWMSGPAREPSISLLWYRCIRPNDLFVDYDISLRPASAATHPDAVFDVVLRPRSGTHTFYYTIRADGWTAKSWNERGFAYRPNPQGGPAFHLSFLPRTLEEQQMLPPSQPIEREPSIVDSEAPTPTPIAHWTFDDPTCIGRDDSGQGHNLTIPGPFHAVPGVSGGAVHFAATDNDADRQGENEPLGPCCPTDGLTYPGPDGFTVSMWVNSTLSSGHALVIDHEPHVACAPIFRLEYVNHTGKATFGLRHEFTTMTTSAFLTPPDKENDWVYVAGVYQPTPVPIARLYVNGIEVDARRMPGPMRPFGKPRDLYAGGSWYATLESVLDDVRIYDRALSPHHVHHLFEQRPLPNGTTAE